MTYYSRTKRPYVSDPKRFDLGCVFVLTPEEWFREARAKSRLSFVELKAIASSLGEIRTALADFWTQIY